MRLHSNDNSGADVQQIVLRNAADNGWLQFGKPVAVLETHAVEDVCSVLETVEAAVKEDGLHAVGFLAYEASPAFDSALTTHSPPPAWPLVWFALCPPPEILSALPKFHGAAPELNWSSSVRSDEYADAIRRIKRYIEAGDTYQVNFTYRLRSYFSGTPSALFASLGARGKAAPYAAFIETSEFAVCSTSPELFFTLDGDRLVSRPMKGTAPRGLTLDQDRALTDALRASEKERAENLMIVDMIRNDMGRIANPGTVHVPKLFSLEKYPTVWQMTSTVEARTDASFCDIVSALFPCASITGAPKVRTMEIIRELETAPRGIYTGAIGCLAPGRQAQFNVAIRTVAVDCRNQTAEYGVGGGIVWDSDIEREAAECATKSRVLRHAPPPFSLLESLLWTPEDGYFLLPEHLARLAASAEYFDYALDLAEARRQLDVLSMQLQAKQSRQKVRMLINADGEIHLETATLPPTSEGPLHVALALTPVTKNDPFLYHKTTNRDTYQRAQAERSGMDDVILWNEAEEVTETCIANLVVELDGDLFTPPVECGLLPGTCRQYLLSQGWMRERVIKVHELSRATRLVLINSVRGKRPAVLDYQNDN